jgi:cysteine desulfurase/selenocysteine lyase
MSAVLEPTRATFDVAAVRADFPILASQSRGRPLVYLDNGATTQKPKQVIAALQRYYETQNANIHRGVYELSQLATEGYEGARRTVQRFMNAAEPAEIIFTRGTTESINLVASSFGRAFLHSGDEVFVSALEHHSNIVPWQMICQQTGAVLKVIPMNDSGELLLDQFAGMVSHRTKIVAVTHLSNSLGTVVPVEQVIAIARSVGAKVLVDGAQWVAHAPTDVQAMDADFYVFSGHKLFGPTGTGVLYGKRQLLDAMPPWQGGGDMIEQVTFGKTTYAQLPNKFEAGTPNIGGAIGLGAAIDYVMHVGLDNVARHERTLHTYLNDRIAAIDGVRLIGTAAHKASVVSFVLDRGVKISSHDAGVMLDLEGIAIRTGHHCCQPVMDRFGIPGTARASVAMYNTTEDVDRLATALEKIVSSAKAKIAVTPEPSAVKFPEPIADSPMAAADELVETFELFEDWKDKYQVLIEMGEKLLPMAPEMKHELTKVHGCQSTVYLFARKRPGTSEGLDFLADSDADVVRGLIAILQRVFAGQSSQQILGFDIEGFFKRLGLDQHLSMGRRNGLAGMVSRLRAHAHLFSAVS